MQEHTIELALARVTDAIDVMYADLLEKLNHDFTVPKPIADKWIMILGHFPDVAVHETPTLPVEWRDSERYAFICRVVAVLRRTVESGNMPATRMRQFVNALGTLAASKPSAIVHSQYLILATCVHKAS